MEALLTTRHVQQHDSDHSFFRHHSYSQLGNFACVGVAGDVLACKADYSLVCMEPTNSNPSLYRAWDGVGYVNYFGELARGREGIVHLWEV